MMLKSPSTGGIVDASGKDAEKLIARGYKPVEQPKRTRAKPTEKIKTD